MAARGQRNEALYVVAVHTGLRQGELLGLRWADLDLDGGTLSVRRSLKVTDNGLDFGPPKNKASRRSVPLNKTAVAALRAHRARQNEERLRLGDLWQDHDLVFPNRVGKPMDHGNWTCVGSVDCLRLRTVRGKENIATNKPDLPTGVSPRSYPAG